MIYLSYDRLRGGPPGQKNPAQTWETIRIMSSMRRLLESFVWTVSASDEEAIHMALEPQSWAMGNMKSESISSVQEGYPSTTHGSGFSRLLSTLITPCNSSGSLLFWLDQLLAHRSSQLRLGLQLKEKEFVRILPKHCHRMLILIPYTAQWLFFHEWPDKSLQQSRLQWPFTLHKFVMLTALITIRFTT